MEAEPHLFGKGPIIKAAATVRQAGDAAPSLPSLPHSANLPIRDVDFRLDQIDQNKYKVRGGGDMKSVGSYEAKTHLPRLLSQVEKGESITITKHGRPVAVLSPAQPAEKRDVSAVIAEFRAYSKERARKHGSLSAREIKEMIEEGRP